MLNKELSVEGATSARQNNFVGLACRVRTGNKSFIAVQKTGS
jgi:hypothetical protein